MEILYKYKIKYNNNMSNENVRVNVTLSKEDYDILVQLAKKSGLKPTTLAKLFIKKVIDKNKNNIDNFVLFND
ncbi:hypothetical protein [Methanobacterium sp. ACI-7]|uniref:hypothetical protein n=1 Tax=unclassified Methanobacterium TaxID=2627676 RepID=UPI0039C0E74D